MAKSRTVKVAHYKHFDAILMKWEKSGEKHDVEQAFTDIVAHLDVANKPLYVVVDLRENTFIPMTDAFKGAMAGSHQHPKLAAWLVIGENRFARYVADVLNVFSDESKIRWFDDELEVDTFLKK